MMSQIKSVLSILLLVIPGILAGQVGGQESFEFLNLVQSSRVTALGGTLISVADTDISLAYGNPASLNQEMHANLSVNHNFHFADISHGFANAGYYNQKLQTTFHIGFNYVQYGNFTRADIFGNQNGEFDAGETAFTLGAGKQINERIRVGLNLKFANSSLDNYSAFAAAGDIGVLYTNPESQFSVGLVAKNIGTSLSTFTERSISLPFDFQIGVSKRLQYLPFRLSITAHQLHKWNIRLDEANNNDQITFLGQETASQSSFSKGIDNFFRHFIFSGEFLLGKQENFMLRFAYNHLRRKELSVSEFRSLSGMSLGLGWKIRNFRFDYGLGYYHLVGATNHLSISINLSTFGKKI